MNAKKLMALLFLAATAFACGDTNYQYPGYEFERSAETDDVQNACVWGKIEASGDASRDICVANTDRVCEGTNRCGFGELCMRASAEDLDNRKCAMGAGASLLSLYISVHFESMGYVWLENSAARTGQWVVLVRREEFDRPRVSNAFVDTEEPEHSINCEDVPAFVTYAETQAPDYKQPFKKLGMYQVVTDYMTFYVPVIGCGVPNPMASDG